MMDAIIHWFFAAAALFFLIGVPLFAFGAHPVHRLQAALLGIGFGVAMFGFMFTEGR